MKKMKSALALLLAVVMLLSIGGCTNAEEEQQAFDSFLWEYFEESVTADTLTLHYTLAHPEDYGIEAPEVTWGDLDNSEEARQEEQKELEETLQELKEFRYKQLTEEQQLTYDVLLQYLETQLEFYEYYDLYEPFAYTSGLQANVPITLAEYKFYDEGDVQDYLQLLEQLPEVFAVYLEFERNKSDKGLFMAENCAEEVIRQCSDYIADPENNVLIDTFNDRIDSMEGITEAQAKAYKQANHEAVMQYVIPAYQSVIEVFEELKDTGKNELGLKYLENGEAYYCYLLKSTVGTDKTPQEIIQLLDRSIDDYMSDLYEAAMADPSGYMQYIEDYGSLYEEQDPQETIRYFETAMAERFPQIPSIEFSVTPVHKSLESSVSPAFYMIPTLDEYERNSIYINEGSDSTSALWSTLAHEGIPGHMYQNVYYLAQDPYPIRTLLNFKGYSEGWATYVEQMSFDYYDYDEAVYAVLERCNAQLSLLIYARIEIGVNYEGWTLEDTQAYLEDMGLDAETAQVIMDYVIAEPVNYQMYCVGWLEFEELRSQAQAELGEDFVELDFHKTVLDAGPCQFSILKKCVEDYIKSAG